MGFISTANERRPQDFKSLEGQNFVVSTIQNAIRKNHFAHAYLFAGPRGVGKTTSARLLAKALNCEKGPTANPCGKCASCVGIALSSSIDCVEIDGASNTSVDDIRKIKNDIMYPPSSRFKIYIIDEVHMLSISAFNALLKTIEEPPEYVIFIFATTELQKVPQTIKSRCQFFKFRAFDSETIIKLIRKACQDKKVKIDEESLLWIAKESDGSMRDAYTLYDQLVSFCGNDIVFSKIQKELQLTSLDSIRNIFISAVRGDCDSSMKIWLDLAQSGVSTEQFVEDFTGFMRAALLYKSSVKDQNVLFFSPAIFEDEDIVSLSRDKIEMVLGDLLELYRNIRYSVNPRFEVELFIAKLSDIKNRFSNIQISKRLKEIRNELVSINPKLMNVSFPEIKTQAEKPLPSPMLDKTATEDNSSFSEDKEYALKSELIDNQKKVSDDINSAFENTLNEYEENPKSEAPKSKRKRTVKKSSESDLSEVFGGDLV